VEKATAMIIDRHAHVVEQNTGYRAHPAHPVAVLSATADALSRRPLKCELADKLKNKKMLRR
jgi:hypothetical protein